MCIFHRKNHVMHPTFELNRLSKQNLSVAFGWFTDRLNELEIKVRFKIEIASVGENIYVE